MVHMRIAMLAGVIAYCAGICTAQDAPRSEPVSASFCDLLALPQDFDGKIVTSEAFMHSGEHELEVYDSKCRSTTTENRNALVELPYELWDSTKLGKKLSKILKHDHTAKVGFVAVFHSSGWPFGMLGDRFHFVVQRILSVEEVPTPTRSRT